MHRGSFGACRALHTVKMAKKQAVQQCPLISKNDGTIIIAEISAKYMGSLCLFSATATMFNSCQNYVASVVRSRYCRIVVTVCIPVFAYLLVVFGNTLQSLPLKGFISTIPRNMSKMSSISSPPLLVFHDPDRFRSICKNLSTVSSVDAFAARMNEYSDMYEDGARLLTLSAALSHYASSELVKTAFFSTLFPFIVSRAAAFHELFPEGLPYLLPVGVDDVVDGSTHVAADEVVTLAEGVRLESRVLALSREQAACIVANIFLCTIPQQGEEFHRCTLMNCLVYKSPAAIAKVQMLLGYFEQLYNAEHAKTDVSMRHVVSGRIVLRRTALVVSPSVGTATAAAASSVDDTTDSDGDEREFLLQHAAFASASMKPFVSISDSGVIEDAADSIHADFANSHIGGGVLGQGAVQEEIMFAESPEYMASIVLCPILRNNEVVSIAGAARFSIHTGYGNKLNYDGPFEGPQAKSYGEILGSALPEHLSDDRDTLARVIVAMDALHFRRGKSPIEQMRLSSLEREIRKAYTAFAWKGHEMSVDVFPSVATGNWGCGAFNGSKAVKLLIQWLAASAAGRGVRYYTFGDEQLVTEALKLQEQVVDKHMTVGELYSAVIHVAKALKEASESVNDYQLLQAITTHISSRRT